MLRCRRFASSNLIPVARASTTTTRPTASAAASSAAATASAATTASVVAVFRVVHAAVATAQFFSKFRLQHLARLPKSLRVLAIFEVELELPKCDAIRRGHRHLNRTVNRRRPDFVAERSETNGNEGVTPPAARVAGQWQNGRWPIYPREG